MKHILPSFRPALAVVVIFLAIAAGVHTDYGLTYDSPKNFEEGRINLTFLTDFKEPQGKDQIKLGMQIHGAFFFMVAQVCKNIFHDTLGWLDKISASYLFIPALVALFLFLMVRFFTAERDAQFAVIWAVLLVTIPRFFGHVFNNPKDVPLMVCYTLAVVFLYKAFCGQNNRSRSWMLFFVCWAFAFLSKTYAIFLPFVLLVWVLWVKFFSVDEARNRLRMPEHFWKAGMIGLLMFALFTAAFFMPAFFSVSDKSGFLQFKRDFVSGLVGGSVQEWSFYPVRQLWFTTPLLVHFLALRGFFDSLRHSRKDPFAALMLILFTFILLIPASPFINVYDGIRHFLIVLVPYTYFCVTGIVWLGEKIRSVALKPYTVGVVTAIVLIPNIYALVKYHPYQTTYFNSTVGGLGGAQVRGIEFADDYWLSSYREAVDWLNANAARDANILVINYDSVAMLEYYNLREDLRVDSVKQVNLPPNTYVVVARRSTWPNISPQNWKIIQLKIISLPKIYTSERGGGEIFTIYHHP